MQSRNTLRAALMMLVAVTLGGCGLAAGIFKGGFIIGLIIAIVVIGLLVKAFGGRGGGSAT